jgi:hypothetical protein
LLLAPSASRAQDTTPIPIDTAVSYFAEARALCRADNGALWGVSLCGPIMFVDETSRRIVANEADAKGALTPDHGAFVGVLPPEETVANTAMEWSGVRWTQIAWPLPHDARLRATLMVHELFHRIQPQLAFTKLQMPGNAHLDELDGRYYMLLEWRALARALQAPSTEDAEPLRDALMFRAMRYRRYPRAAADERALEMNEGLAEYTGVVVGNPRRDAQTAMALRDLSSHAGDATFVRSFAYATGPAYGMLLDRHAPGWRRRLTPGAGLDSVLRLAVRAGAPNDLEQTVAARALSYDGAALRTAESERDRERQKRVAIARRRFIDGPTLTLPFRHMNVQFDPRNLQPLGDAGTVYPTIHVSDDWGIVDATNGALMKPDWSALILSAPPSAADSVVRGDGWSLTLKPGWSIVPATRAGDFVLSAPSSSH